MKATKILVPIDFSPCSTSALKLAATLARDTGAKLLLLHVDETLLPVTGGEYFEMPPAPTKHQQRKQLNAIAIPHDNLQCERYLEEGSPVEEIVRLAKEQQVDFIVMGTHGRKGLSRLLMGSIAEGVMRRAPCPVITLKEAIATEKPEVKELEAMT